MKKTVSIIIEKFIKVVKSNKDDNNNSSRNNKI